MLVIMRLEPDWRADRKAAGGGGSESREVAAASSVDPPPEVGASWTPPD